MAEILTTSNERGAVNLGDFLSGVEATETAGAYYDDTQLQTFWWSFGPQNRIQEARLGGIDEIKWLQQAERMAREASISARMQVELGGGTLEQMQERARLLGSPIPRGPTRDDVSLMKNKLHSRIINGLLNYDDAADKELVKFGRKILTPDEANEIIEQHGNPIPPVKKKILQGVLSARLDIKSEETVRRDILERSSLLDIRNIAAAFAGSITDPVNIAAAFIPLVGTQKWIAMGGKFGQKALMQSVPRGLGAIVLQGAVENLALEAAVQPFVMDNLRQAGLDYTMTQAVMNVAMAGTFGAVLPVGIAGIKRAVGLPFAGLAKVSSVVNMKTARKDYGSLFTKFEDLMRKNLGTEDLATVLDQMKHLKPSEMRNMLSTFVEALSHDKLPTFADDLYDSVAKKSLARVIPIISKSFEKIEVTESGGVFTARAVGLPDDIQVAPVKASDPEIAKTQLARDFIAAVLDQRRIEIRGEFDKVISEIAERGIDEASITPNNVKAAIAEKQALIDDLDGRIEKAKATKTDEELIKALGYEQSVAKFKQVIGRKKAFQLLEQVREAAVDEVRHLRARGIQEGLEKMDKGQDINGPAKESTQEDLKGLIKKFEDAPDFTEDRFLNPPDYAKNKLAQLEKTTTKVDAEGNKELARQVDDMADDATQTAKNSMDGLDAEKKKDMEIDLREASDQEGGVMRDTLLSAEEKKAIDTAKAEAVDKLKAEKAELEAEKKKLATPKDEVDAIKGKALDAEIDKLKLDPKLKKAKVAEKRAAIREARKAAPAAKAAPTEPIPELRESQAFRTGEELKATSEEDLVKELATRRLTHVSGPGMGATEFSGTFLSTEAANRNLFSGDKLFDADVTVSKTKVFKAAGEWPALAETKLKEIGLSKDSPLSDYLALDDAARAKIDKKVGAKNIEADPEGAFEIWAGKQATKDLKKQGFDSAYLPESEFSEGILVVFDRKNVKLKKGRKINELLVSDETKIAEGAIGRSFPEKKLAELGKALDENSAAIKKAVEAGDNAKATKLEKKGFKIFSQIEDLKKLRGEAVKPAPVEAPAPTARPKADAEGELRGVKDEIDELEAKGELTEDEGLDLATLDARKVELEEELSKVTPEEAKLKAVEEKIAEVESKLADVRKEGAEVLPQTEVQAKFDRVKKLGDILKDHNHCLL